MKIALILFFSAFLVSCETMNTTPVSPYDSSSKWRTTDNGITVWSRRGPGDTQHRWDGPVNKENKAHGFGKMTMYAPETGSHYENHRTHEGNMVDGRFEGEVIFRRISSGAIAREQFTNGEWVSNELLRNGTFTENSSDDSGILGAMVAVSGAAAGSADLTMSGVSMMAGNKGAALQHVQNFANTPPGSNSGGHSNPAGSMGPRSVSSHSRNHTEPNLVDSYGLGRFRNGSSHITHFIASADEAYARYKQTGESAYYGQHRQYADQAKDFHKNTATQGTRTAR